MHGSHWCKYILSSLRLRWIATSAPHVQQPENLKAKFIGPSLEALTKESCSDACDAENGLQLLLTEKFPFDGKADSPLSAASTRLSSNTSLAQAIAVSWIHQTLADHFTSPLTWAFCWFLPVPPPPPPSLSLSLSPSHNTYLSLYFSFLHLFSFINVCPFAKSYKALL